MRDSSFNKKAGLSVIMTIILILVGAIVVFGVTARFVNLMSQETQQSICSANVIAAGTIIDSEDTHWTLQAIGGEAAEVAVKNPLCTTIVNRVDLSDSKPENLNKNAAVEIGEMIENCWSTFGEGTRINTFDQGTTNALLVESSNYYFPCYKFKLHLPDASGIIEVSDLMELTSGSGWLWKYNTNKREIKEDVDTAILNYLEGDAEYKSYAAYVFFGGNGYIEFMESVDQSLRFGTVSGVRNQWFENWLFTTGLDAYRKSIPGSGTQLDELEAEKWYEVRYYSPFIRHPDKYFDEYSLNNIKIVPADEESTVEEIDNIGLS